MAWNTSYYMSSWITSEYTNHEVFEVVKHSGSVTKDWHSTIQGPASSPKMWSPRQLFRAWAPSWLPSHRVGHHWATWTCHSTSNTQTFLQPKRSTSKAWATKTQQDWPVNVVINSRLLVCKASSGRALLCQTDLKRESLLSNFSSIQNISKKGTPYSNHIRVTNN
jgi:hypothetical protein